jgi:hypothetical protein
MAAFGTTLRESKVGLIASAARALDAAEARAAEAKVLDRAGRMTPAGLRAAIIRAVMEVAPEKARKRREQAARDARVQRWAEDSGNAALMGRELPPAEVLAADQRITAWARQLRKAGLDGSMDELRARAYLDLLLGQDSRPAPPPAASTGSGTEGGADGPASGTPASGTPDGGAPDGGGPRPPAPGPRPAPGPPPLTIPLAALTGLADRPGEMAGIGPLDLARGTRRGRPRPERRTTWCVTVTSEQGRGRPQLRPETGSAGSGNQTARGPVTRAGRAGPGRARRAGFCDPGWHGPPADAAPGSCAPVGGRPGPAGGAGSDPRDWRSRFEAGAMIPGSAAAPIAGPARYLARGPGCRRPAASDFGITSLRRVAGRVCVMAAECLSTI